MALNAKKLNNFIGKIKPYSGSKTVENQYLNSTQIDNLEKYLINIEALRPTVLFVGEAAGYKGCALTGIPFISEHIISNTSYPVLKGCVAKGKQKEGTATIVWEKLEELILHRKLSVPPLMWNIFPFHPHKPRHLKSNRKPTTYELITGARFLADLISLFPSIKKIYAVGDIAALPICMNSRFAGVIPHPSYGGKPHFVNKINSIYP